MTPAMISECETYIIRGVAALLPGTPIIMSGQPVPADVSVYVRFWVVPSEEVLPIALGRGADSRNVGLVQASVYGPKDRGAGETGDIAHAIRQMFHRHHLEVGAEGYVQFKDAGVKDMGDMEEEHLQVMRCPYRYDFES